MRRPKFIDLIQLFRDSCPMTQIHMPDHQALLPPEEGGPGNKGIKRRRGHRESKRGIVHLLP